MPAGDGGLGEALIGEKIAVNGRNVAVTKLLGEGGFSYVYLVKELGDNGQPLQNSAHGADAKDGKNKRGSGDMVLKVTSIHSRAQRDIAEKEAKLLSRLSHPSIIKMYDTCYRQTGNASSGGFLSKDSGTSSKPQHVILMEYCEGGHALDVCNKLASAGKQFDLSTLIIAFGQICNAVSYLHAQRPPIVHRDLKPVNFLVKNGAYKLCDFGSAVFGHVDLRTQKARAEAEECIEKTTTQMFRAPEMVDLYSTKRLTQATDVWALGCCLYSLAFLQNCFEEGSNLAILSRKYKIPDDNSYGEGLVELLDRMLTVDPKERSDMTEVILCLSAVYSGRPLPPRKKSSKPKKESDHEESKKPSKSAERVPSGGASDNNAKAKKKKDKPQEERVGTFRTDGQGIYGDGLGPGQKKEVKKLNPNSAAARRRQQAQAPTNNGTEAPKDEDDLGFTSFNNSFSQMVPEKANQDLAFSTAANPFAAVSSETKDTNGAAAPTNDGNQVFDAFASTPTAAQADPNAFATFDSAWGDVGTSDAPAETGRNNAEGFGEFDTAKVGVDSALMGTGSQKGEGSRKARSRRSKPGHDSGGENLEDSMGEMNVSGAGHSGESKRRHRDRSQGERRSGKSKGDRPRRPKEQDDPNAPPRRRKDPDDSAEPRRASSKGSS